MSKTTVKEIKDIGWDKIQLSAQTGFSGAVKAYKGNNGKTVALCFNTTEAFIVEDELGLFGVQDLYTGLLKEKSIDVEATGQIVGAKTVAFIDEDTKEVMFIPDEVDRLTLNSKEVQDDIVYRITELFEFLTRTRDVI